jgi:RNA polymerase sigma factor (sigma-70 family)
MSATQAAPPGLVPEKTETPSRSSGSYIERHHVTEVNDMANGQLGALLRQIRRLVPRDAGTSLGDGQLLERFVSRQDQAAFTQLLARHGGQVWGVCRRVLGNEHDAEDAFQATFLALALKAPSLTRLPTLAGWLHGAAYRSGLQLRRTAARRRAREHQAMTMAPRKAQGEVASWELQAALDEEVQRLPDKYRAPFVLCCLEGKRRDEAARQLGCKEGTLSSRLAKARKRLRGRLGRRGLTLAGLLGAAAPPAARATVPAALATQTAQAALRVVAGQAALAGFVSTDVAIAVREASQAVVLGKLKAALAVLLAFGALGGAALLTQRRAGVPHPPEAEPVAGSAWEVRHADPRRPGAVELTRAAGVPAARKPALVAAAPAGAAQAQTVAVESNTPLTVAFSPAGNLAAAGGLGKKILIWDAQTGQLFRALASPGGVTRRSVVFSPDGRVLAAGGDDRAVHVWDVQTGKRLWTLRDHAGWVLSVAFSPDGRRLAASSMKQGQGSESGSDIRLWDMRDGKLKWTRTTQAGVAQTIAFSPDGRTLASAQGGMIRLRDPRTGAVKRSLVPWRGQVLYLAFAPDGRTLAGGGGRWVPVGGGTRMISEAHLWDMPSGKLRRTITDIRPWLRCVAFAPDGKVLATGSSGPIKQTGALSTVTSELRLWDAQTGQRMQTVPGALGDVSSIVFSPDGRAILSCDNKEVVLTEALTGLRRATLMTVTWGPATDNPVPRPRGKGQVGRLSSTELEQLWRDLADADAGRAYRAIGALVAAPRQAVPLLAGRVQPAEAADAARVARLLADLDSKRFAERERAARALEKLADSVEEPLRRALSGGPSAEVRRRVQAVLDKLDVSHNPELLRRLRAVEVLEHVGTADARAALRAIARGAATARLTREAKASLERLAARPAAAP